MYIVAGALLGLQALAVEPSLSEMEGAVHTWQTADGIPADSVTAIIQTSDGFLWVGTREGLARFDGHDFAVFNRQNTPAFRVENCLSLCEDTDHTLWIGLIDGLARLTGDEFKRIQVAPPGEVRQWIDKIATALLE